jgi:hypothetical protein
VTFLIFPCFAHLPDVFTLHHKAVILSEAPRRSIAYRKVYGAESKDPGAACWQMLFGAFRPRTIRRVKKSHKLRAKPRDLQFPSHQPPRPRTRTADPAAPPDLLSGVAASVGCVWFSLGRTVVRNYIDKFKIRLSRCTKTAGSCNGTPSMSRAWSKSNHAASSATASSVRASSFLTIS